MKKCKLGDSDIELSILSFGCMSLSAVTQREGIGLIREAYDWGVNYFDTADLYERGANEQLLGKALHGIRDRVMVGTKVGNAWEEGKEGWTWNPSRRHIMHSVENSLQRLRTDYIDLYQLHGGTINDNFEEIIETFERLKEEGKIRQYGLSSIRPNVFQRYLREATPVSNMMQYSPLDTRPEEYFPAFSSSAVSILARGSLAQGLLVDKPMTQGYLHHTRETASNIVSSVAQLATQLGVNKETVAWKYVTTSSPVASCVVGVRTVAHLVAVRNALTEWDKVTDSDVEALRARIPKITYLEHRDSKAI